MKLLPVPSTAVFRSPDHFVWCGTMTKGDDGRHHLYYSRWPREMGFHAWVTHSEVAHAVGDHPFGEFAHRDVALPARGPGHWDGLCTHNPTVQRFGGRYYLYYMGNTRSPGLSAAVSVAEIRWDQRNRQRIGVAVADSPDGPWQRLDVPLIAPQAGFHDALCCANPTVTARPRDGGFLMIYKAVGDRGKLPFGGPVVHVAAVAAAPEGPFEKLPAAIFTADGAGFAAEDPFVWADSEGYHALVKDMGGYFTGRGVSIARMASEDGFTWRPAADPLVATREIAWADGMTQPFERLERPQLHFEHGRPVALILAALEREDVLSYSVRVPLG